MRGSRLSGAFNASSAIRVFLAADAQRVTLRHRRLVRPGMQRSWGEHFRIAAPSREVIRHVIVFLFLGAIMNVAEREPSETVGRVPTPKDFVLLRRQTAAIDGDAYTVDVRRGG